MNKFIASTALFVICMLGFALRLQNIATVPLPGQSQDEYSNAWVGLSIIQIGMPVGISGVKGNLFSKRMYINPDRIFQQTAGGDPMTVAYPWFDHPPLVGLIVGGFAHMKGVRVFEDASVAILRKPAVAFSVLTITLIGIIGMELFGLWTGIFASLFYAISPLTTISNRMVQAENFLIPIVLASLYYFYRFGVTKKKFWWYLGATSLMIAMLMKLSSIAFVIAAIVLLKKTNKQSWPWVMVGVFALAAISWWAIWGVTLSSDSFWGVLFSNSRRTYGIGYQAVSDLFTTVKITGAKTITDGWILASFLGLLALIVSEEKHKDWIVYPSLCYLVIYLFFGSESYGWYRLPFFPFTFIALGHLTTKLFERAELLGMLLFLIPLGVSASKIIPTTGSWLLVWRVVPIVSVVYGLWSQSRRLNQVILTAFIISAILTTVIYNLKIDVNFWYQLS